MGVLIPGHLSCKYKAKATLLANQKIVVPTPIHTRVLLKGKKETRKKQFNPSESDEKSHCEMITSTARKAEDGKQMASSWQIKRMTNDPRGKVSHTALSVNCSAGVRASIDVRSKKLSGLSKTK